MNKMTSYDVIGSIAILHFIDGKTAKLKSIAKKILKHKNIKAVYSRGKIKGRLRIPELRWLAGTKQTEIIHRESGCIMKLDIKSCYFSPRLSTDRLEIARKIKKGDKVLVMFSGIAPYSLVIAKHSKAKEIVCIELSRIANKYARENILLNKFDNIKIIQGDVKRAVPQLRIKFDRIIMARPRLKESFLREAFKVSKKGTVIHFYDFVSQQEFPKVVIFKIKEEAKKVRNKIKVLGSKRVREIAPFIYHGRIDFIVK